MHKETQETAKSKSSKLYLTLEVIIALAVIVCLFAYINTITSLGQGLTVGVISITYTYMVGRRIIKKLDK